MRPMRPMPPFADLVAEAMAADTTGWGFGWLDGRATEERPPWGYARLLGQRLALVASALDIDTGGGEVLAEGAPVPAPHGGHRDVAAQRRPGARRGAAAPRGVEVVQHQAGGVLPFPDESFELVTARLHPVRPDWRSPPGPRSGRHLLRRARGTPIRRRTDRGLPRTFRRGQRARHRAAGTARALAAGLVVEDLRTARCRMAFSDVGAIVFILRKCIWWVPDFSVERYHDVLVALDAQMRAGEPVVAFSTRHLLEARRPAGEGRVRGRGAAPP